MTMVGSEFCISLTPVTIIDRWLRLNRCNILQSILNSYGVRGIPMNFVVVIQLGCCEVFFHWKRWESEKFLQSMIGFLSDSSRWKICGIDVRENVGVVLVCHCRIWQLSDGSFHCIVNCRIALAFVCIDPRVYLWSRCRRLFDRFLSISDRSLLVSDRVWLNPIVRLIDLKNFISYLSFLIFKQHNCRCLLVSLTSCLKINKILFQQVVTHFCWLQS